MTGNQMIKKLRKSGRFTADELSSIQVRRHEIEVFVEDAEREGKADDEATEAISTKVFEVLGVGTSGYVTGYGAQIVEHTGRKPVEMGEYCDTSSRWHY